MILRFLIVYAWLYTFAIDACVYSQTIYALRHTWYRFTRFETSSEECCPVHILGQAFPDMTPVRVTHAGTHMSSGFFELL